jgi:hypothetical protein
MRNRELERIAALVATAGDERAFSLTLGKIETYLRECGIEPDDFEVCLCPNDVWMGEDELCPLCTIEEEERRIREGLE